MLRWTHWHSDGNLAELMMTFFHCCILFIFQKHLNLFEQLRILSPRFFFQEFSSALCGSLKSSTMAIKIESHLSVSPKTEHYNEGRIYFRAFGLDCISLSCVVRITFLKSFCVLSLHTFCSLHLFTCKSHNPNPLLNDMCMS